MNSTTIKPEWMGLLRPFARPSYRKAIVQLIDTLLPYGALILIMNLTIRFGMPVWVTLLLGIPAGAFMVRAFILFHDCCHGSFVGSRKALDFIGRVLGFITFTPYGEWRYSHGIHHSTSGNLDRRGVGDVWTMTAEEYRKSPPLRRAWYRTYRNPVILFVIGPLIYFTVLNRLPGTSSKSARRRSVILNDLVLAASIALCALTIGIKAYLLIMLPTLLVAGFAGIWLFYVQHQFDPTYWARSSDWDSVEAAMSGSSWYKLPVVLQWISGNIGLHHVHHLLPRIPNYNLRACLRAIPELQLEQPLTLAKSFKAVSLNLWDEAAGRLIAFRELRPARGVVLQ